MGLKKNFVLILKLNNEKVCLSVRMSTLKSSREFNLILSNITPTLHAAQIKFYFLMKSVIV
jgi:hypothetical protein